MELNHRPLRICQACRAKATLPLIATLKRNADQMGILNVKRTKARAIQRDEISQEDIDPTQLQFFRNVLFYPQTHQLQSHRQIGQVGTLLDPDAVNTVEIYTCS